MKVDKLVTILAAISAPTLTFGVDQHWWSAVVAAYLGGVVATVVGVYHIPNDAARRALGVAPPAD